MATTASPSVTPAAAAPPISASPRVARPAGEITRDIARGGLAALLVGVVLGGIGGRIVMRLAALAVPDATGMLTENGNRVGTITLDGSLGLVVFVGLLAGVGIGVVWVTIYPWIPGTGRVRALLAMPIAVGLGSFGLVDGRNPDFIVLRHDPRVVGVLIALVALVGLAVALVDAWADRRLPRAAAGSSRAGVVYAIITTLGLVVGLPLVVPQYLFSDFVWVGAALVVVGLATLGTWMLRVEGRLRPPGQLRVAGYGGLAAAVALGYVHLIGQATMALGLR